MREGLLESNPASGTNVQPEKSRARVLSGDELKLIWNATVVDDDYSTIMRLLMLSGQRREEIGGLRWSEVLEDRIALPGVRTKNGHAHSVPLTAAMRRVLAARVRDGEFVFGARDVQPFSGWGSSKAVLDRRISATDVKLEHWTQHDLRRTMATWLAESGIAPHIIEAILNHVSGHKAGGQGIYNRAGYEPQKRAALERWGDHIETLVGGKRSAKIVRLGA
jgi:integrase